MHVCLIISHADHLVIILYIVIIAIRSMRAGKNVGVDDICSDSLKHVSDQFIDYIVSLFNSILSHGCVPSS